MKKIRGFDVSRDGDLECRMEARLEPDGVLFIERVFWVHSRAPRPDPGTDKADNGLQDT
jgi:hypothetical protein